MKRRQILVAAVGILAVGLAVSEHLYRRLFERRYESAVQARHQLEQHLQQTLAANHQILGRLLSEQERTVELSGHLQAKEVQLQQALDRLAAEERTIEELQGRMGAMQTRMDEMQEELVLALEKGKGGKVYSKDGKSSVELERIIVSDAESERLDQGRVVSIHPDWSFVVVDLGWDHVKIGDTISIFRNDALLAKARVERVQEGLSAATVLPEWPIKDIRINDIAKAL